MGVNVVIVCDECSYSEMMGNWYDPAHCNREWKTDGWVVDSPTLGTICPDCLKGS